MFNFDKIFSLNIDFNPLDCRYLLVLICKSISSKKEDERINSFFLNFVYLMHKLNNHSLSSHRRIVSSSIKPSVSRITSS